MFRYVRYVIVAAAAMVLILMENFTLIMHYIWSEYNLVAQVIQDCGSVIIMLLIMVLITEGIKPIIKHLSNQGE